MQERFASPSTAPRVCVVCENPLAWHLALTPRPTAASSPPEFYPVCSEFGCRAVFEQTSRMPDAAFRFHLRQGAQRWRERQRFVRLWRAREAAGQRQSAEIFAAIAQRRGVSPAPDLNVQTPAGHARPRPLSQKRRRAYVAHLDSIIAAAFSAPGPEPAPPGDRTPDTATERVKARLTGQLCGFCGGGCCTQGGGHAYLTEGTIRRVMADNPGLDQAGLRALYLLRLKGATIPGSCVHHTPSGCSLPRALRSDTCNAYACDALKSLQAGLAADPPVRSVAVLRRRQNQWRQQDLTVNNDVVAAAMLTEAGTRRLRIPWQAVDPDDAEPGPIGDSSIASGNGL